MMRTDHYVSVYVPSTGRYVTSRATEGQGWEQTRKATEEANPTAVAGSQAWHCYGCGQTVSTAHAGCQLTA